MPTSVTLNDLERRNGLYLALALDLLSEFGSSVGQSRD